MSSAAVARWFGVALAVAVLVIAFRALVAQSRVDVPVRLMKYGTEYTCMRVDQRHLNLQSKYSAINPSLLTSVSPCLVAFRATNYTVCPTTSKRWAHDNFVVLANWDFDAQTPYNTRVLHVDYAKLTPDQSQRSRGGEDPRLIAHAGRVYVVVSAHVKYPGRIFGALARMVLMRLNESLSAVDRVLTLVPRFESIYVPQKNWMHLPTDAQQSGSMLFVTRLHPFLHVAEVDLDTGAATTVSKESSRDWFVLEKQDGKRIHGGSTFLKRTDDAAADYIAVAHTMHFQNDKRMYLSFFLTVSPTKPYRITSRSPTFCLNCSTEASCPGIQFTSGMGDHGDQYIVTMGESDCESTFVVIPKSVVHGMLSDIPTASGNPWQHTIISRAVARTR